MKTVTKRILEITILLSIILGLIYRSWEQQEVQRQYQECLKLHTLVNQVMYDKYGPGRMEPYEKWVESYYQSPAIEMNHYINAWFLERLPLAVPSAPVPFQEGLAETRRLVEAIPALLESGPCIPAPDEIAFSTYTLSSDELSIDRVHTIILSIQQVIFEAFLQGDIQRAGRYWDHVMALSQQFEFTLSEWDYYRSLAIRGICLRILMDLLWFDLSQEELEWVSLHAEKFRSLHSDRWKGPVPPSYRIMQSNSPPQWNFPPFVNHFLAPLYWNQNIIYHLATWERPLDSQFLSEYLTLPHKEVLPEDEALLREAGIPVNQVKPFFAIVPYTKKWTTIPAIRKRAQTIPDAFFANDPLFSVEQAKHFPSFLYAASKIKQAFLIQQAQYLVRYDKDLSLQAQMVLHAVNARKIKTETGNWPMAGNFHIQDLPDSKYIKWRTEDYSDPFPHFIVEHIFQKVQSFAEFQYSLGEKEIVIQIPMKNEHRESGASQPGSSTLPDLHKLSTQYVQWFTEAAALYPFFAKSETDLSSFLDL
ncbi:MAG: hypothetical protein RBU29_14555, partial [bacterium]|nr:hypothetical protein [bacterium]